MRKCSLPTRKECLDLIKQYHVPPHILKHSLAVAKLGVFLAQRLNEKGVAVDAALVDRACLLHDILRACDFKDSDFDNFAGDLPEEDNAKWRRLRTRYRSVQHEQAAYEILKQEYPELALTVKKHRYMALLDEKDKPETWEEKLVYYADKRVMRDKIVPLKQRLAEAHKRNVHLRGSSAQSKINIAKVDPLIFNLEEEIFDKAGLSPTEVTDEFINRHLSRAKNEE